MAYAVLNEQIAPASFVGKQTTAADVGTTTAEYDTYDFGSASFKHVKGKLYIKANSGTIGLIAVRVNTTTDTTGDETVFQVPSVAVGTGILPATVEFSGSASAKLPFRYVKIAVTGQTTATMDVVLEVA